MTTKSQVTKFLFIPLSLVPLCLLPSSAVLAGDEIGADLSVVDCTNIRTENAITINKNDDDIRIPNSNKGDSYTLIIKDGSAQVEGKEKKRKTRLSEDAATLLDVGKMVMGVKLVREPELCVEFQQQYKRSTLSLTTQDVSKNDVGTYTLITGPDEHWYLSADMPVNSIKQLDYDSTTSSIIEKEKPASFYLGFNWKVGDVYTNYKASNVNNVSVKFLFKPSSTPSESMGIGLGYSFDAFDLFVAKVWTKDAESVSGSNIGDTESTIFGVSFNISKALEWLKSE